MKTLLAFLAATCAVATSYASALGPIIKKSDVIAAGFRCENEAEVNSKLCSAQWRVAKAYCEHRGSRLPTILELATAYAPRLIVSPPVGSDYPLPFKQNFSSIDAFNYDGFTDPQNPLKKLDQFYFSQYEGVISNDGPDKVEGSTLWSLSTEPFDGVWAFSDFTKVATGERVSVVLSFYYPHFDFSFRCVQ